SCGAFHIAGPVSPPSPLEVLSPQVTRSYSRPLSSPPVVVRRIVPRPPTAVPVFASTQETPTSPLTVPLAWRRQDAPPSVVRRIVPYPPTAVPVFTSVKETPPRIVSVPLA